MMTTTPIFWRDPAVPHVELRYIEDGRQVRYAPHSHQQWSLGVILAGQSYFQYGGQQLVIETGQLLLINPHQVHACNPCADMPWSYYMLYIDTDWLTRLRKDSGELDSDDWKDLTLSSLEDQALFNGFNEMATRLFDPHISYAEKDAALRHYLQQLFSKVRSEAVPQALLPSAQLHRALEYLHKHYHYNVTLQALCQLSELNPGQLNRQFRETCGMKPHAYLTNLRIQMAQIALQSDTPLVDVALTHGFADQPHFQRTFKRLLAATPMQYRDGPKRLYQQQNAAQQQ